MLKIIILIAGLAVVAFLIYRFTNLFRGGSKILCNSCLANSPRYCHLSMRGSATHCEDYSPRHR